MSGWQSIESAPKDGTSVLLCEMDDGEASIRIGWWCEAIGLWDISEPFLEDWTWTHWMPLPNPPAVA